MVIERGTFRNSLGDTTALSACVLSLSPLMGVYTYANQQVFGSGSLTAALRPTVKKIYINVDVLHSVHAITTYV